MAGMHSLFAPSKAVTWVNCHASLAAAKGLPKEPPSEDAARGTAKHDVSEQCLSSGSEPEAWLGETIIADGFEFKIDAEFVEQVKSYVDAIRREPADEKHYEVKLDMSGILGVPEQGGTSDAVLLTYNSKVLDVRDAKFGFHRVFAEKNEQLLMYAAGALVRYDLVAPWEKIKVAIHQPSIDHEDEYVYTRDEVIDFAHVARNAAQAGYALYTKGTPEQIRGAMNPGPRQCQWCPARKGCPARAAAVLDMFKDKSAVPVAGPQLSDPDLAGALSQVESIQHWCTDIEAEARRRALTGGRIPGYKLVRGKRSARYWKEPEAAKRKLDALLGELAYEEPKLISPTAVEKLKLSRDIYSEVAAFVGQNDGQLQLVPDAAKGEPVTISDDVGFTDKSAESLL
jgi:hypothetical protein